MKNLDEMKKQYRTSFLNQSKPLNETGKPDRMFKRNEKRFLMY